MRILTTSGLYFHGTAEEIFLAMSRKIEQGVEIHDLNNSFLSSDERDDRYKSRTNTEVISMTAEEVLRDLEAAGHLLIAA